MGQACGLRLSLGALGLLLLSVGPGCGEQRGKAPVERPAPAPAVAETPPAAAEPTPTEAPSAEAPPVAADAGPAPDTSVAPAADAGPAADGLAPPVAAFRDALYAVEACERSPGSIQVLRPATCLAPLQAARDVLRRPGEALAPTPEEAQALRGALAEVLLEALSHESDTVVLYALLQSQPDLGTDEETRARLEALMDHGQAEIAELAAAARLWRRDPGDLRARVLAEEALERHRVDRVRLAACQFLGDPMFRGERAVFDTMAAHASDGNETALVRTCAVTRLGYVGGPEDIKTIAGYLDAPLTQHAAVHALQRGLASKAAHHAYFSWFSRHANKPGALQWSAVALLVPPSTEVGEYPRREAEQVLKRIAGARRQEVRVRVAAIEGLGRLGDKRTLSRLKRSLDSSAEPARDELVQAVDKALGAAP